MEDNYIIISVSEDGDVRVAETSAEDVARELDDGEHQLDQFRSSIGEHDPMYWGSKPCLLIKGRVVVPKAAERVVRHEVE